LLEAVLGGETVSFTFNSRNQLLSTDSLSYRYDAENQRIALGDTQLVVSSQPALSQVLVRTKGNGQVTYYVYGLGLIGEASAGSYFSYHFDFRGSTVALTDDGGVVIERVFYSPFGTVLQKGQFDTPFLFNGLYGVMTDGNGLYYMRARYYSPDLRRFVNRDVVLGNVTRGQSLNRFAFVEGNPVSFVDPFGLARIDVVYTFFPITIPHTNGMQAPLGHAALVAVDPKTGLTRYYEYGRYDGDENGKVKRRTIPNLKIGKDGKITEESLESLYEHLSEKLGKGYSVWATYHKNADYNKLIAYVEWFMNNPHRPPYSVPTNTCYTFVDRALEYAKRKETPIPDFP